MFLPLFASKHIFDFHYLPPSISIDVKETRSIPPFLSVSHQRSLFSRPVYSIFLTSTTSNCSRILISPCHASIFISVSRLSFIQFHTKPLPFHRFSLLHLRSFSLIFLCSARSFRFLHSGLVFIVIRLI